MRFFRYDGVDEKRECDMIRILFLGDEDGTEVTSRELLLLKGDLLQQITETAVKLLGDSFVELHDHISFNGSFIILLTTGTKKAKLNAVTELIEQIAEMSSAKQITC